MRIVRKLTWDLLVIKASAARMQARHNETLYMATYAALRHILDLHSSTEDETGCRACDEDWPCSVARIAQGAIDECRTAGAVERNSCVSWCHSRDCLHQGCAMADVFQKECEMLAAHTPRDPA